MGAAFRENDFHGIVVSKCSCGTFAASEIAHRRQRQSARLRIVTFYSHMGIRNHHTIHGGTKRYPGCLQVFLDKRIRDFRFLADKSIILAP